MRLFWTRFFFVFMLISSFSYSESQNTTTESQITTTADECDRKISYGKGQNECIDVFKLNDAFIDTLQKQIHTLSTSEWYTTIDKLGKLALYLKLYRRYIYWPDGRREGLKKFPDTPVPFHEDIWTNCSLVNDEIQSFVKCVEYIYRKIQESVSIMFLVDEPLDYGSLNKEIGEKFEINEENFKNYVDGSTFSFETTSQYFFCWLAMNRLSIMEKLPYCEYGPDTSYDENGKENNQSDIIKWITHRSLRFNGLNIPHWYFDDPNGAKHKDANFRCAQESFCPDPCCGMPRRANCNTDCENTIMSQCSTTANISITKCEIKNEFNNDFVGIMNNQWNRSCDCTDVGMYYDFEVRMCVDVDECIYVNCAGEGDNRAKGINTCVNKCGGYTCTCPMLYYYDNETQICREWNMTELSMWFNENPKEKKNSPSRTNSQTRFNRISK